MDRGSGKAFCEPSCKIKNGGCKIDEECTLKTVECFTTPCPPEIVCVPKGEYNIHVVFYIPGSSLKSSLHCFIQ